MTVSLNRAYQGVPAGQIVSFTTEVEAALIAQNLAAASTRALTTAGAQTQNSLAGTVIFAAAATSVVVTNSLVDANSHVTAKIAQSGADGTFTFVARVLCAAGSFTIFANAAATAATLVDWEIDQFAGQSVRLS